MDTFGGSLTVYAYVIKRLALMIPTLFLILLTNFMVVQFAPGGPVAQKQAQILAEQQTNPLYAPYRGKEGLSEELVEVLKAQYGFDQPAITRFWLMLKNYAKFELGDSFFKSQSVGELIQQKLPVSVGLGLASMLMIYVLAILLALVKVWQHGRWFDWATTMVLVVLYAVPMFVFALVLLVLFAGGSFWQIFPLQGVRSAHFETLGFWAKLGDYAHHLALPLIASSVGGLASVTYLCKFALMEELGRPYVQVALARGLSLRQVLLGHVLKNASLPLLSKLPMAMLAVVSGNFLIEIIFNLDGIGLLGFEAVVQRDYPVVFGLLFCLTLFGMLAQLVGDVLYHWIDPRIDFQGR